VIFEPTRIPGAYLVRLERQADERGFFARTWCADELAAHGAVAALAQSSVSWNRRRGTLRGLHYQAAPHEEAKVVWCIRGAVWDVVADLRPASPTFRQWFGVQLDAAGLDMLYVPPGLAHGFLTLADDTLVHYQISERYRAEQARGVRWDDPSLGIAWPETPVVISDRDRGLPLLDGASR
jgi:dTDP-4-dehydrorhamnose 3,5-epimerase